MISQTVSTCSCTSILLLICMSREFMGHKKEMLKFAWSFLKREDDSLLRHWAYIHVCRLIQARGSAKLLP